jgi:hypothetical protein
MPNRPFERRCDCLISKRLTDTETIWIMVKKGFRAAALPRKSEMRMRAASATPFTVSWKFVANPEVGPIVSLTRC